MQTPIAALLAALALALPAAASAQPAFTSPQTAGRLNDPGNRAILVQGKDAPPQPPQQQVSDDPSFRLTNRGSITIQEVYVSSVRTDDWGEDRLGADVLEPGQSIIIRLPRGDCLNDIRIVFDDDSAQERRRVDTCAVTDIGFP